MRKKGDKTVGQAALEADKGEKQEVGETLEMMSEGYAKELSDCLKVNKSHDHYFIVVLRKKEPLFQNVVRQWFIAPRMTKPRAKQLKVDFPLFDHDVWEVKKGDPAHLWSLPSPEGWKTILAHPEQHDRQLVGWMLDFEAGNLP